MRRRLSPSILGVLILFALALSAPLLAEGPGATLRVKVELDYGPKGKGKAVREVLLAKGGSVVDATKKAWPTKQGFVCCDEKDVKSIDGVQCDPKAKGWWLYEVNGKMGKVAAHRKVLKDGDRVTWRYRIFEGGKRKGTGP